MSNIASTQSGQTPYSTVYNYTLNSVSQTKRLLEKSSRPPMNIKHSNFQLIRGTEHPTSVSIDCNAGVYLSAVKPALEGIAAGWRHDLLNTADTCEDVSHRNDVSGRRVCTKLVLYLSEHCSPQQDDGGEATARRRGAAHRPFVLAAPDLVSPTCRGLQPVGAHCWAPALLLGQQGKGL